MRGRGQGLGRWVTGWTALMLLGLGILAGCRSEAPPAPQPSPTPTSPPVDARLASQGRSLAQKYACLSCHSIDGLPSAGPTWKGLYGSLLIFTDGTTAVADEDYLRESMKNPLDKVVLGFAALMPSEIPVSDEEIDAIIAYIKSLR